ncbi:MAG: TAXI family TRAP transporter solute-binding subunit [Rickettsiales bacterium]|nr:TAXI family TRAP transporter solute-binding subunit [Rickettsiales bacterium]
MKQLLVLIFLATLTPQLALANNPKQPTSFTIFSGDKKASFFAVASGICKVFNKHYAKNGYECIAVESKGSESNLRSLANGEADLAVVKTAEFNKFFVKNFSDFENKIDFVARIHDEYLTILVQKNLQIRSLNDLNNRLVNIGSIGSSSALIVDKYFSDFGVKPKKIVNFGATKSFEMMCDKKIDAWVYFVGHPNLGFRDALDKCDLELIPLAAQEIKNFLTLAPFLQKQAIAKELYKSLRSSIFTISTQTILASRKEIDPEIVMMTRDVLLNHRDELVQESLIFRGF